MSETRFDSAVVVLGMHRSGTSALTGVLRSCGLAPPRTLIPSSETNERGFWESAPINALNDSIFDQIGLNWRSLDAIGDQSFSAATADQFRRRIVKALQAEYGAGSVPLIKDPRICRLLGVWQPALLSTGAKVYYPLIVRNPVEIAHSLQQRNDIDFDHALLLWARYYLDAEHATRDQRRHFVFYPDLLEDWRRVIQSMYASLGRPLDLGLVNEGEIDQFLSSDLRHQRTADEAVGEQIDAIPLLAVTFQILGEWARSGIEDHGDRQALDDARRQLDELGPFLSGALEKVRLERKRRSVARLQADEAVANLERVGTAISELGIISAQVSDAAGRLEQLGDIATLVENQKEHFGDLGRRLRKLIEQATARAAAMDEEQKGALAAARAAIDELASATREQGVGLSAALGRIDAVVKDDSAIKQLADEHAAKLSAVEHELEGLRARLDDRARLDAALADALEQASKLRHNIAELEQRERDVRAEARLHLGVAQMREEELLAANVKLTAVSDELKTVKRKYRSTQEILARERERLKEVRAKLGGAEATVARFRASYPWRVYVWLMQLTGRLRYTAGLLTGQRVFKRKQQVVELVEKSALFDRDWYLDKYPDVASSDIDPIIHYLENGWREGRDPGPGFSTTAYLKAHADVAAHGINPLLHYVEYGHSEGRGAAEHAEPSVKAPEVARDFGPAAPCVSVALAPQPHPHWRRAGEFDGDWPSVFRLRNGLAVARFADESTASSFRNAQEELAFGPAASHLLPSRPADSTSARAQLVDIWFVASNRLRSRWRLPADVGALIVRTLQHVAGEVHMVGESPIAGHLDFVDSKLVNPFFPLLFVFTDADGMFIGSQLLAFPSLCRGGLHYPEYAVLLQDNPNQTPNLFDAANAMAADLGAIRSGQAKALIADIAVDLAGADGTPPLFQLSFQQWLAEIAQVSVRAREPATDELPARYLERAVRVEADGARTKDGATLYLASDMVPSLGVLCAHAAEAADAPALAVSLIRAGESASQPALLCHVPAEPAAMSPDFSSSNFPRLAPAGHWHPVQKVAVYAVRMRSERRLAEAELLVPTTQIARQSGAAAASITWLYWPETWIGSELLQSLESLGAQSDCGPSSVLFVGPAPAAAISLAARLFDQRVQTVADIEEVAASIDTQHAGYIGPRVILHEHRTASVLSRLLEQPGYVSASAAIVSIDRRGKGFVVTPVDLGAIAGRDGAPGGAAPLAESAGLLWRSAWSSARPPKDLWLTRREDFAEWIKQGGAELAEGSHACSAIVTASYCGPPTPDPPPVVPPAIADERALLVEAVAG